MLGLFRPGIAPALAGNRLSRKDRAFTALAVDRSVKVAVIAKLRLAFGTSPIGPFLGIYFRRVLGVPEGYGHLIFGVHRLKLLSRDRRQDQLFAAKGRQHGR